MSIYQNGHQFLQYKKDINEEEDIQMKQILLSIKPEYVERIMSGEKRFEFRKVVCAQPIDSIVIYETFPTKQVVGEVEVIKILKSPPQLLWPTVKDYAGIDKDFFDRYFDGKRVAIAYALGKVSRYDPPKKLSDFGFATAPQSYFYIE